MPDYETLRREIKTKTQNSLDFRRDFSDEEVKEVIDRVFLETREISLLSVKERRQLNKEVFDSLRRLDILQEFVDDPSVTEDLNSTNGTFKNGLRLKPYEKRRLMEGDEIRLGSFNILFR